MIIPWGFGTDGNRAPEYKPYKNTQFNKKMAKAEALLNSINETSLKKEDKYKLKQQISELFKPI